MNSCIHCKFARKGLEECLCYAKCNMQESDFTFKIPQEVNYNCEYAEPISRCSDLYLYTDDGTPITPITQDIWKDVWG